MLPVIIKAFVKGRSPLQRTKVLKGFNRNIEKG